MKNKAKIYFRVYLLGLAAIFLIAGCRSSMPAPTAGQTAGATREITDDLGRKIVVPRKIERAVSLAPNLTETAFAVGAGDRLVGVTTFCDYPAEAQKIQKIGDTISPNIESIIALKPQIVLVSTASQIENFTRTLDAQSIAVFVTNPNDLEGIYQTINQIGGIFSEEEKARQLVGELKKRVAAVEAGNANAAQPVKTFLQISREPLFTIGRDSFLNDLIARAGGDSVTKDVPTAYPKLSKETASAMNPQAIILSDSEDNPEPNAAFKNSDAVKKGRVFRVNADLLSRPGPRIVDALEQMAKELKK